MAHAVLVAAGLYLAGSIAAEIVRELRRQLLLRRTTNIHRR